jgi:hypothetical protein
MQIKHEIDQGPHQPRTGALVHDESGPCYFRGPFEVENVEGGTEIPVGLGFKTEIRGLPPFPNNYVFALITAHRDGLMGNVGDAEEDLGKAHFHVSQLLVQTPDALGDHSHLTYYAGCIAACLLHLGNLR